MEYGYALMKGRRPAMEDTHHAALVRDPKSGDQVGFFGIFDGHGGADAAHYVREKLFSNLLGHAHFPTALDKALPEVFRRTDADYLASDSSLMRDDGCCGTVAVVQGSTCHVAHVGDSRAILVQQAANSTAATVTALSVDHKPDLAAEKARIEKLGGVVVWAGTWRVSGVLAVSRAFGNRMLKDYVKADPDVKKVVIQGGEATLIVASDGVWDVISNEEAMRITGQASSAKEAAVELCEEAFKQGSMDNISAVVIRFF